MGIGAGERIKRARKVKNFTVEDVAKSINISVEELERIENGDDLCILNWTIVQGIRLAVLLGLRLSEVIGEEVFSFEELALILTSLIEYSSNKKGLHMEEDIALLVKKVGKLQKNINSNINFY